LPERKRGGRKGKRGAGGGSRKPFPHPLGFAPQDTALAYLMMGALYLANDAPEGALYYLNIASQYDPDRPVIYLNLGHTYNKLGDYEKATEAFRTYVQRNPGSILAQEIFRIVEKYQSIQSQNENP
jgi:tetratricopeptide (TPR) repeat protein